MMNTIPFKNTEKSKNQNLLRCRVTESDIEALDLYYVAEIGKELAMNAIAIAIESELGYEFNVQIYETDSGYQCHINNQVVELGTFHPVTNWINLVAANCHWVEDFEFQIRVPELEVEEVGEKRYQFAA